MGLNTALARAKAILVSPKMEWPRIAERSETVFSLYKDYLIFLVAIPVIAGFVRGTIIGVPAPWGTVHVGIAAGLSGMVVRYVLWLALIYVLGLIVNALAPNFDGQKNQVQAVKTVAYAFTGAAVGSIGELIPKFGLWIAFAGVLYTFYLFYLGLPVMMKTPAGKALRYMGLTALASVVAGFAVIFASSLLVGGHFPGQSASSHSVFSTNPVSQDQMGDQWLKNNELLIQNSGTHIANEIYVTATAAHVMFGDSGWGANILGNNLVPGDSEVLNKGAKNANTQCKVDMKIVYADGTTKVESEIDLCNTGIVTLHY